jgi:hypothetical protein
VPWGGVGGSTVGMSARANRDRIAVRPITRASSVFGDRAVEMIIDAQANDVGFQRNIFGLKRRRRRQGRIADAIAEIDVKIFEFHRPIA